MTIDKREELLKKLPKDQIALIEKWKGLPPQGVALEMCKHFEKSFPDWKASLKWYGEECVEPESSLEEIAFPKSNSWVELQPNLKQVTRQFVFGSQCYKYWDAMRKLFFYLPGDSGRRERQRESKKQDRRKDGKNEKELEGMGMCSLCWRAVPKRKGITSKTLCQNHYWSSTHPEYKRRFRMKYGKTPKGECRQEALIDRYFKLLEPLKTNQTLTYETETSAQRELSINDAWRTAPHVIIKLLPHVHDYLLNNGTDITSSMSIIEALEAPLPEKEKDDEIAMRTNFYEDCKEHFRFYVEHLIWAEIWLDLDVNTKPGGRRPGAGRKPKQ